MANPRREPVLLNDQMDGSEPPNAFEILGALRTNLRLVASDMEQERNASAANEEEAAAEQSRLHSLLEEAMELNSITQIDHYLHQATSSLARQSRQQEAEDGSTEPRGRHDAGPKTTGEDDAGPKTTGEDDAGPKTTGEDDAGPKTTGEDDAGPKTTGEDDSDVADINLPHNEDTIPPLDGKIFVPPSEKLPSFTAEEEQREQEALSESERMTVSADLHGFKPATEQVLIDVAFELEQIPKEDKTSLEKALRAFPLLTHTSSHVMLFLHMENGDPKRSARRAVEYWEKRERLLGDHAFKIGTCSMPTDKDFLRLYVKATGQALDPEAESEMKKIAMSCLRHWEQSKISALVHELEMIPVHQKTALAEAQKESPELAASDEHMLLFLRSMDFDERKAAHRMVDYWKERLELFGHDEAFQPITAQSLMDNHGAELAYGFNRALPGVDAFGRVLIYGRGFVDAPPDNFTYEGILKSTWYVLSSLAEKLECQMNGMVIVGNGMTLNRTDAVLILKLRRIGFCMPVKIKALHDCKTHVPWWAEFVMPFVKWALGKTIRLRLVQHIGTNDDILAGLQEHGISRYQVPSDFGGEYSDDSWIDWLNQQEQAGH